MGPAQHIWGGGWWIFPIVMGIIMLIFFFLMSRGKGFRPSWMQDSDSHHRESTDSETPSEILKKRYAKGEITKEEFENMKKDL